MKKNILHLSILLFSLSCMAQEAVLIADLNPGSGHSLDFGPDKFMIEFQDKLYFSAISEETGLELWVYDGDEVTLVKDINPGSGDSDCDNFFILNDKLIFMANDGIHGDELWETNGTEAGTNMIVDLLPGTKDGVINCCNEEVHTSMIIFKDELYFNGNIDGFGRRLFKTDGTAEGTKLVAELGSNQRNASSFIIFNDELFFTVIFEGWWKTDGTEAGTILLKDMDHEGGSFEPLFTYNMGDYMIMVNEYDWDLWRSDGTVSGTTLIRDMFRPEAQNNQDGYFVNYNGVALFTGADATKNAELWRSDGTNSGTYMVKDVEDNSAFIPKYPRALRLFNNQVYYIGGNDASDNQLYRTDGTEQGTLEVLNLNDQGDGQVYFQSDLITTSDDGHLFFVAGRAFNRQLWYTDGTKSGTYEIVVNPNDQATPERFFLYKDKLIFFANGDGIGFEPHYVDITQLTTNTSDFTEVNTVSVYPNPAKNTISISELDFLQAKVTITDVHGHHLLSTSKTKEIDITGTPPGIYIINISDENSNTQLTSKFTIVR